MERTVTIPFNLSLATDDNVRTKDGSKVKIIYKEHKGEFPLVALVTYSTGEEYLETYTTDGRVGYLATNADLVLEVPESSVHNNIYEQIEALAKELHDALSNKNSKNFNLALQEAITALHVVSSYF